MFVLLPCRVLVLPDPGSTTEGQVVLNNLRNGGGIVTVTTPEVEPPEVPGPPETITHNHIVFVREMAVEVELEGVTHLAMHRNAIVGYLD